MITKEMLEKGYDAGIIRLIMSPHDSGVVCQIGNNWFYFSSSTGCDARSVADYLSCVSKTEMLEEIFDSLSEFPELPEMADEYKYYESYLYEKLQMNSPEENKKEAAPKKWIVICYSVHNRCIIEHTPFDSEDAAFSFIQEDAKKAYAEQYLDAHRDDKENVKLAVDDLAKTAILTAYGEEFVLTWEIIEA